MIGGGPSGAVVARLLASWGHEVRLLTRLVDVKRTLANSLPPSTRKLLVQTGVLDVVERVGFRTHGNTVWWGAREGHVEPFSADGSTWGYQVDRARLDPLLLDAAAAEGVAVERDAAVRHVDWSGDEAIVLYEARGGMHRCRARLTIDCSGRSGALAVNWRLRQHVPGGRMQALVGVWTRAGGWFLQNPTHTFIETCHEGWAWSIPTTDTERHVGIMVDGATSRLTRRQALVDTYLAQLALTERIDRQVRGATPDRVFACDATVYTARAHAGDGYFLVGDAGSTLNPLSSFGIKKALASAWLGAVSAHTSLIAPERAAAAQAFFSRWSAQTWQVNLARSREFAVEARAAHRSPFWDAQASLPVDDRLLPLDDGSLLGADDVRAMLARFRESDTIVFSAGAEATHVSAPVVRGNEVVVEDAVALGPEARDIVRYVRGIDLVALADLAPCAADIPLMYEEYCTRLGSVPLPDFLGVLALLAARHVLGVRIERARSRA
ncbi:MAG: FAD-dependent monooxygenase [Vicinamibacterales bacterium]